METAVCTQEFRVFGPPGCGKTTYLAQQAQAAAAKYGPRGVLICSYTRAAAAEIASRNVPVAKENIGTLHAICFRHLGHPNLAQRHEKEFNKDFPQWSLTSEDRDVDDPYRDKISAKMGAKAPGDALMAQAEVYRAKMMDPSLWTNHCRTFYKDWCIWKERNGLLDFTDLLEICLRDTEHAPGGPAVALVDEVQDSPKLQLSLIRKWGRHTNTLVISGDDDQTLYSWCGASPDAFLDPPVPPEQKRVLSQSYRVPKAVHALAEKWIARIKRREPKEYRPRREVIVSEDGSASFGETVEGKLEYVSAHYKYPEPLLSHANRYLADGKTVMFLASCSYMLNPMQAVLRKQAIPFHNPYRRTRGDWNPLGRGGKKKTTAVDRVLAFLLPDRQTWDGDAEIWTWHDFYLWASQLRADGVFHTGGKAWVESLKGNGEPFDAMELMYHLTPEAVAAFDDIAFDSSDAAKKSLEWWYSHCLAIHQRPLRFPLDIAVKHGGRKLRDQPKVIIGTVHSVKGGQADVVYLMPDLSHSGMQEWMRGGEAKESVIRMFYVGMTRARETLVLCQPASPCHVEIR